MHTKLHLVHYGDSEYRPHSFRPISDEPFSKKPRGGLWTSPVNSEFGWKDWCEAEGYSDLEESFYLEFRGSLLVIDSVEDLKKLPWIESVGYGAHSVVFQCFCVGGFTYDAIHLTKKGLEETAFSKPFSLYGWDCECVLILNPDSIFPLLNDTRSTT
jgi:hypothetical protein